MKTRLIAAVPRSPRPSPGMKPEALRREPEQHRSEAVGDAVDDDVDRVLERDALSRGDRQIQQLVARLVDREAEALIERIRQEHRPQPGTSQMIAVPKPSAIGRTRTVTAMPNGAAPGRSRAAAGGS